MKRKYILVSIRFFIKIEYVIGYLKSFNKFEKKLVCVLYYLIIM